MTLYFYIFDRNKNTITEHEIECRETDKMFILNDKDARKIGTTRILKTDENVVKTEVFNIRIMMTQPDPEEAVQQIITHYKNENTALEEKTKQKIAENNAIIEAIAASKRKKETD